MEFKESHEEVTFSKLHKSTKPEKNNMYHKRRKEASNTGYTMVKEVQMEKGKKTFSLCSRGNGM